MNKPMILALAIVMAFSVLLFADRPQTAHEMNLVTSFDFARYPACEPGEHAHCIVAIRFYDADSKRRLAEVETIGMRGRQKIVSMAKAATLPHRVYAVTVYLDSERHRTEGPRGQMSELRMLSEAK